MVGGPPRRNSPPPDWREFSWHTGGPGACSCAEASAENRSQLVEAATQELRFVHQEIVQAQGDLSLSLVFLFSGECRTEHLVARAALEVGFRRVQVYFVDQQYGVGASGQGEPGSSVASAAEAFFEARRCHPNHYVQADQFMRASRREDPARWQGVTDDDLRAAFFPRLMAEIRQDLNRLAGARAQVSVQTVTRFDLLPSRSLLGRTIMFWIDSGLRTNCTPDILQLFRRFNSYIEEPNAGFFLDGDDVLGPLHHIAVSAGNGKWTARDPRRQQDGLPVAVPVYEPPLAVAVAVPAAARARPAPPASLPVATVVAVDPGATSAAGEPYVEALPVRVVSVRHANQPGLIKRFVPRWLRVGRRRR